MNKILVVEDNESYRFAAADYFQRQGVNADFAIDYKQATSLLSGNTRYSGAIVDCFFPYETGSGNIDIGRQIFRKILPESYRSIFDRVGQYVYLEETPELYNLVTNYAAWEHLILRNQDLEEIKETSMEFIGDDPMVDIVFSLSKIGNRHEATEA